MYYSETENSDNIEITIESSSEELKQLKIDFVSFLYDELLNNGKMAKSVDFINDITSEALREGFKQGFGMGVSFMKEADKNSDIVVPCQNAAERP